MNIKYIFAVIIIFFAQLILSCSGNQAEQTNETISYRRVGAASGSLARIWQLAGGAIYAATEDAFSDYPDYFPEDIINLGSLKNPNLELILASNIDFMILSSNIAGHEDLRKTLKSSGIDSIYLDVESFSDYLSALRIFCDITQREDLYKINGEEIENKISNAIFLSKDKESPRILLLRAYSSGISAKDSSSMAGIMLKDLGCINIADGGLLEELSLEIIIENDPDFIFVTTMGNEEQAINYLEQNLIKSSAWSELKAVKNNKFYILQKDLFHLKPCERWAESYDILARLLYE